MKLRRIFSNLATLGADSAAETQRGITTTENKPLKHGGAEEEEETKKQSQKLYPFAPLKGSSKGARKSGERRGNLTTKEHGTELIAQD
jgi:hypothetical protein